VAVYVVVAVAVAVLGTLRDSWRLTALATVAIVVFTTVQSFAVFAQIIEGAWLFVVLGLVFCGTGFLFDRARRELATALEGENR
jgi:K+ transporter